jgi:hypothetical protein
MDWSVAYLLGTGTIGTAVFLLLLARVYRPWEGYLLLPAGLTALVFMGRGGRDAGKGVWFALPFPKAWIYPWRQWMTAVPAAVVFALLFIGSLTPAFGGDELWYHLMAPKLYLQEGGMFPIPHNVPSNYPLLAEMVYVWGLSIGTVPLCKLLQWAAFVCAGRLMARWGETSGSARAGGLAVLFLVTARAAAFNRAPCQAGSDEWLLAYLCVTFFLLSRPSPPLLLSGVFLGFSLSTKLTAIPYGLVPAFAVLLVRRSAIPLRRIPVFLGVAFLVVGGWWIRTAVWTGDPVFPLGLDVFPVREDFLRPAEPIVSDQLGGVPYIWSTGSPLGWLRTTAGSKANWSLHEGDFLILLTLWLPMVAVFSKTPGIRTAGIFGTVTGILFLASHVSHAERFFAVTQFVPALLGGVYLDRLLRRAGPGVQRVAVGAVSAACLATYWHNQTKWSRYRHISWNWRPPVSREGMWEFLETRQAATVMRRAYARLGETVPQASKVLILGCWGEFYCPRPVYPTGDGLAMHVQDLAARGDEELLKDLTGKGVTHVLAWETRAFEPGFSKFRRKYLREVWETPEGVVLYRLEGRPDKEGPD